TETTASGTAGQARADVTAADVTAADGATTGSTGAPVTCRVIGGADTHVSAEELDELVAASCAELDLDGRTVTLVVPDGTRSCPLPMLMATMHRHLVGRVAELTAVIAL